MKRYLIQDKNTGKFLRRVTSYGSCKKNTWVVSADDATLITTSSAVTNIVNNLYSINNWPEAHGDRLKYRAGHYLKDSFPVKVIPVEILIYPVGVQPFIDGVLNGNRS